MKVRLTLAYISFGLTFVCIAYLALSQTSSAKDEKIQMVVTQLPQENGIVPVQVNCEDTKIENGSVSPLICILKNNTTKPVIVAGLSVTVQIDQQGKKSLDSGFLTFDSQWQLSPGEEGKNLIPPLGEYRVLDAPSDYGTAVVQEINVKLDYVEFADQTSLGSDSGTSRLVREARTGAAKYRNWLNAQLQKKSVEEILPVLENYQGLPPDTGVEGGNQEEGAKKYRSFIRRVYMTKGAEGVRKQLKAIKPSDTSRKG